MLDRESIVIKLMNFLSRNTEGRPLHSGRIVFISNKEILPAFFEGLPDDTRVVLPHRGGQSHQRCPVINEIAGPVLVQFKKIPAADHDIFAGIMNKILIPFFLNRRELIFREERFHGLLMQFNPVHAKAERVKPYKIFGFPAQRNKDLLPFFRMKPRKISGQLIVIIALVESGSSLLPGLNPKFCIHLI